MNTGKPLFIACVGVWVGGHPSTKFSKFEIQIDQDAQLNSTTLIAMSFWSAEQIWFSMKKRPKIANNGVFTTHAISKICGKRPHKKGFQFWVPEFNLLKSDRKSSDQKSYLAIFPTMETIDFLLDALLPLLSNAIFDSDFLTDFTGWVFSAKVCILTKICS